MTASMPGIMTRPAAWDHRTSRIWDRSVRDAGLVAVTGWQIAACTIGRVRRFSVIFGTVALAVAGCSAIEDKIDSSVNDLASQALSTGVESRLAEAGIELEGSPDCQTDLDRDGGALSGTATCDAVTVEGRSARATFDGTLSGSGCTGIVTIEVEGEVVVDGREVPDCSVQL